MEEKNNIAPINVDLNVVEYETNKIKNMIYTIRGKQVMLDSDVAMLYKTETKKINQAVKRNIERFPEKFCFQLNEIEFKNLKSQFVTSSLKTENSYGGRRKLPLVLYHVGASLKDLGKKCFAISKIQDKEYIEKLSDVNNL